jgi:hypothetical protein
MIDELLSGNHEQDALLTFFGKIVPALQSASAHPSCLVPFHTIWV